MIIIGDVHGCYDTLIALLDKIPEEEKKQGIIFCGDLIDRGPKSRQVVEFVRNNDYHCVKGNHEDMMVCSGDMCLLSMKKGRTWSDGWSVNGGRETVNSYYDDEVFNEELFLDHMEWMEYLPSYIEFPEIKNKDGRYLVVSHSHVCNVWKRLKSGKELPNEIENHILWGRPRKLKQVPEIYNVIGHTPNEDNPRIKKPYANLDTACFVGLPGWEECNTANLGRLTALKFPEMKVYHQDCIDIIKRESSFGEIEE